MTILGIHNLSITFGEKTLFENANINIEEKDKVGLIGANGTGKSTMFNMITGALSPTGGNIIKSSDCKIGYLQQHTPDSSDITVIEQVLKVFEPLKMMENELSQIAIELDTCPQNVEKLTLRYNDLHEKFEKMGGLTYKSRAVATLKGLGFSEEYLTYPLKVLSGGEKTRVMLSSLLLSEPSLLLLDEPTNHLDIDAVNWLEDFLISYKGAFIAISHDRYFLDRVTTKTVELENGKFHCYNGNYTAHLSEKAKQTEVTAQRYKNQMKEIKRIEGIIETQRRWNREKNIKTAESKEKQLAKLKDSLEAPEKKAEEISFSISPLVRSGKDVLKIENLSFSYDSPLLNNINMELFLGDRAFLLGGNGCGKTTLFDLIVSDLQPASGNITLGKNVQMAKYSQTQSDLHAENTILDEIRDAHPTISDTYLRGALAAFLIKGDEVFKPISMLSGGERAKVALLKIILSRPNFLLLDEPTNHLDIISKEALEAALMNFDGTMLVISHDRYFINKLATRVFQIENREIRSFNGNYDYYLAKKDLGSTENVKAEQKKPNSYKEEKAFQAKIRKLEHQISDSQAQIEQYENLIENLENQLLECSADYIKAMEISKEIEEIKSKVSDLYVLWEELDEELKKATDI